MTLATPLRSLRSLRPIASRDHGASTAQTPLTSCNRDIPGVRLRSVASGPSSPHSPSHAFATDAELRPAYEDTCSPLVWSLFVIVLWFGWML